jgi:tetratricopeptide (TPR) repeat protein
VLSLVYLSHEAQIEFCADRPDQALRIFENERKADPQNMLLVNGVIRSLALLGRFDEALALWRTNANSLGDSALVNDLATAKGAAAYWELRHRAGRKRLAKLMEHKEDATPFQMIMAQLAAGDPEAAYRTIDDAPASEKPTLYRLSCYQPADEYKHQPRFLARVKRIGALGTERSKHTKQTRSAKN